MLIELLHNKVDNVDWDAASREVKSFLSHHYAAVAHWNKDYFHNSVDLLYNV